MANEPFISVVVAYLLLVAVFVAVTATPGSAIVPDFTVPRIDPAAAAEAAGAVAAAGGGVVSVVCGSPVPPVPVWPHAVVAGAIASSIAAIKNPVKLLLELGII
jgi:hypothetical protein